MHPLIRFAAFLVFLSLVALSVLAGPQSTRPIFANVEHLRQSREIDYYFPDKTYGALADNQLFFLFEKRHVTAEWICSCQVLNLGSSNYDHLLIVLLAEKSGDGSGDDSKEARNCIFVYSRPIVICSYSKY